MGGVELLLKHIESLEAFLAPVNSTQSMLDGLYSVCLSHILQEELENIRVEQFLGYLI